MKPTESEPNVRGTWWTENTGPPAATFGSDSVGFIFHPYESKREEAHFLFSLCVPVHHSCDGLRHGRLQDAIYSE